MRRKKEAQKRVTLAQGRNGIPYLVGCESQDRL